MPIRPAQPVETISLKDVFFALELQADVLDFKHMAHQVYDDEAHVRQVEDLVKTTLEAGLTAFYSQLDGLKISDLLQKEAYPSGAIDWNERVK